MRGKRSVVGEERWTQNGYLQKRTDTGWRYVHHLIAESQARRTLRDNERVVFLDGDRKNLNPNNIAIRIKSDTTRTARITELRAKIDQMQAELDELEQE